MLKLDVTACFLEHRYVHNLHLLLSPAGFVLFTLGLVIFIPGFYYSRISYYAYKGHPGFSFDTIPAV